MPISVIARPPASTRALPNRCVSLGIATATAKFASVIGRNARPAPSGLKPKTLWRYCVMKNQKPIIAPRKRSRAE
jgi:hypothetical protein